MTPPHKSRDLTIQDIPTLSGRVHRMGLLAGAVQRQVLTRNGAEQQYYTANTINSQAPGDCPHLCFSSSARDANEPSGQRPEHLWVITRQVQRAMNYRAASREESNPKEVDRAEKSFAPTSSRRPRSARQSTGLPNESAAWLPSPDAIHPSGVSIAVDSLPFPRYNLDRYTQNHMGARFFPNRRVQKYRL